MNDIIEYAYKQLNNNAYGELILPIRKKIWKQFGSVDYDNIQKDVSDGIKRRVKLAELCIEKVIDLWDEATNNDKRPYELLNLINEYIEGNTCKEKLKNKMDLFENQLEVEAYEAKYEKVSLIGLAAVYAANIVLYDELLFFNTDENDLDEELDCFTWDTSYLISLVCSDGTDENERKEKKKEFWKWYLREADKFI